MSVYHKSGNAEADEKMGLASILAQASASIARTGVLYGLAITQTSTASGSVQIAMGAGVVQATLTAGAALVYNPAPTLNILTANPVGGLPRNDIVVFDSTTGNISVIVGTPNAAPTDPTIPATALPLARIRNIASATSIDNGHIDDLRKLTSLIGGLTTVADSPSRALLIPWSGRVIFRQDTGTIEQYNGTSWVQVTPGVWQDFSPGLFSASGATAIGTVSNYGRWRMLDAHTVQACASATRTAGVTVTDGLAIALPMVGSYRNLLAGDLYVCGSSVPTGQSGMAFMSADKSKLIPVGFSNGYLNVDPSQEIRYSVTYEV